MKRFDGKRVVVTGSTRGLGRVMAERFAGEGASVAVTGRSGRDVENVLRDIRKDGGSATGRAADLSNVDEALEFINWAIDDLGGVDILVKQRRHEHSGAFSRRDPGRYRFPVQSAVQVALRDDPTGRPLDGRQRLERKRHFHYHRRRNGGASGPQRLRLAQARPRMPDDVFGSGAGAARNTGQRGVARRHTDPSGRLAKNLGHVQSDHADSTLRHGGRHSLGRSLSGKRRGGIYMRADSAGRRGLAGRMPLPPDFDLMSGVSPSDPAERDT